MTQRQKSPPTTSFAHRLGRICASVRQECNEDLDIGPVDVASGYGRHGSGASVVTKSTLAGPDHRRFVFTTWLQRDSVQMTRNSRRQRGLRQPTSFTDATGQVVKQNLKIRANPEEPSTRDMFASPIMRKTGGCGEAFPVCVLPQRDGVVLLLCIRKELHTIPMRKYPYVHYRSPAGCVKRMAQLFLRIPANL